MTDPVRFEVCCRLACMRHYLALYPDHDTTGETGPWFLEGFLVEYYNDVGREDWIAEELLGWRRAAGGGGYHQDLE